VCCLTFLASGVDRLPTSLSGASGFLKISAAVCELGSLSIGFKMLLMREGFILRLGASITGVSRRRFDDASSSSSSALYEELVCIQPDR
jgi:hypothetical protein